MTPMMRQYHEAKQACGDALLLFRMGDFYELFHEDAKTAAGVLGLTLTSRDKDSDNPTAMAGFPHHQLDAYLHKLIRAGFRAAVCEQVEDPKTAKGLVKREVTRLVSAGTLTDEGLLDPREPNYLVAIYCPTKTTRSRSRALNHAHPSNTASDAESMIGIAWAELSSGRFEAGTFPRHRLDDELARIAPAEVLFCEDDASLHPDTTDTWSWTARPKWSFAFADSVKALHKQFSVTSLEGLGFDDDSEPAIQAAGGVLAYLKETQRTTLDHFRTLISHHRTPTLQIDAATRRSLEITRTMRTGTREGSLLGVIDRTVTPMGSRLLADELAAPLIDLDAIELRAEAVSELVDHHSLRRDVRAILTETYDLSRLLARLATKRSGPRDLSQIAATLSGLPTLKARLTQRDAEALNGIERRLQLCPELRGTLESALVDDCPITVADGNFIREGYDADLDSLRELARGGKQWIAEYQQQQMDENGVSNLKVGYNRVFGYYLEVSNTQKDKVPASYVRKQTLKNCERYITAELKEYEEKVLSADEQATRRELAILDQLRQLTHDHLPVLQDVGSALARLDVFAALAEVAAQHDWKCPVMTPDSVLRIEGGRHPVLDVQMPQGEFVPNDCATTPESGMILLITGPNMAGKSTYIRQTALIALLAQVGSFVPATKAEIGIADRIFARVGASDELSRGQSTFMVEMVETARILNTATSRSLVILDEIGRGTSTYDGLSLAWAITEHLHEQIGCRALFATHYHELATLADTLPRITNLNVAVKEWQDEVVFLHRIISGSADKSYGIQVARLAGIPAAVNERAREILSQLEASEHDGVAHHQTSISRPTQTTSAVTGDSYQLTLFGYADHPVIDQLNELNVDAMTPMEALQFLQSAKTKLAESL
ncbi:MAG: DNA mismatch repair protein MutS [Planctomycetota bacterium]